MFLFIHCRASIRSVELVVSSSPFAILRLKNAGIREIEQWSCELATAIIKLGEITHAQNFFLIILQLIFRLEVLFELRDELLGRCGGRVTLHRFAIFIDNKLGEIPLDSIEESSTLLLLQILPQGMGLASVHVDFLKQIEFDFIILCETLNLFTGSGFLVAELIAGKCENSQTCNEKIN